MQERGIELHQAMEQVERPSMGRTKLETSKTITDLGKILHVLSHHELLNSCVESIAREP